MSEPAPSSPRRRLAFVSHEFPPFGGGAASALDATTAAIAERGHDVTVVIAGPGKHTRVETRDDGREVVWLGARRRSVFAPGSGELVRALISLRFAGARVLKTFEPDTIVAYFGVPSGLAMLPVARSLGVPLVVSLRGSDVPGFAGSPLAGPLRHVVRQVWRRADLVVANGAYLASLARDFAPEIDIVDLPNGIDTQRFHPDADRTFGPPVRFLVVGQLIERKRPLLVLDAFLNAADTGLDATLTFAGDGPLRAELERRAAGHQHASTRVQFAGTLDRGTKLPDLYRRHHVLVHVSRAEGAANAPLEALASGLDLILSPETSRGMGRQIGLTLDRVDIPTLTKALRETGERQSDRHPPPRPHVLVRDWSSVAEELESLTTPILGP